MKELHESMIFRYLLRELNVLDTDVSLCRERLALSCKADEVDALEYIIAKTKYDYCLQTLVNVNRILNMHVGETENEKRGINQ